MLFTDRALIDGPARITRDGYLVAEARVAKANNIQAYRAGELGLTDRNPSDTVRVFRPEAEVFAKDALASAAHRPITLDHPKEDVSASNWKALSVGDIGGDVIRDGEFVRVPLKVMDAGAVRAASSTHQEFSLGYSADLDMTPGKFGDAEYDASMRNIRVNHLALCDTARGGPELRIVDERPAHLRDHQEQRPMKIKIGDAEVDLSDGAAVALAVGTLNQQIVDERAKSATTAAELTTIKTDIAAKDAEIVTLKKAVEDSTLTPEKLRDAAKNYALATGKAKALGVTVADSMDEPAIMKAVVDAKMGDAAKAYTPEQISAAFAVLTKDAKPAAFDPLAAGLQQQTTVIDGIDPAADREKRKQALRDGWKQPAANAA
jgi:hypothetical protein